MIYDTETVLLCMSPENDPSLSTNSLTKPSTVADNLFFKIEQTQSPASQTKAWDVLFKNVGVKYSVTAPESNSKIQDFKFIENSKNSDTVNYTRTCTDIQEAVRGHFNDIQRGTFHGNLSNKINPNANAAASYTNNTTSNFDRGIRSPLDQFEIRNFFTFDAPVLGNLHISYTNIALYLTFSSLVALFLNLLATNYNKVAAHRWSISQESIYATIHSIVINQINEKNGQKYYPFIYCLFIIILVSNLIGMIPYSFASTSHFILTFFLSFSIVLGSTILGFFLHNIKFFSLFVPSGCPLPLLPLLVLIEFISFLARNVSLGLRLAANILSGHMLLNILSDFTYKIMDTNFIYFFLGLLPLMFIIAFSALELGIAFIQAQVFAVLGSSYIKDSLELH